MSTTRTSAAVLSLALLIPPAAYGAGEPAYGPADPQAPRAAAPAQERDGVRDRLLTGLFFRGELADFIMEAGLQDRFVTSEGLGTRAELRLALMDWIYANPEKAADLYLYLKDRRPGGPPPDEAVDYETPVWGLQGHFLEMAGLAEKAAAGVSMSDEEVSLAAQRLFEAAQAPPEAYAPLLPAQERAPAGAGPGGAKRGAGLELADHKLHPERVENERRTLELWMESLKALEAGGRENSVGDARVRRLLDETFVMYRDFTVVLSNLKTLKRISGTEAARVEKLRRAFRKKLGELEGAAVLRRMDRLSAGLREEAPGASKLRAQAAALTEEFEEFLSGPAADPENAEGAARRLYELERKADLWALKFFVQGRIAGLWRGARRRGFSCVLDGMMFRYLYRYFPSSGYARLAGPPPENPEALAAELDAAGSAAPSSGRLKALLGRISAAEERAGALRAYSRLNRRLQFVFWDSLFNPLGLRPVPGGISAGTGL